MHYAAHYGEPPLVKSGIMVGLGERQEEIEEVCNDLHEAGVNILTIGQYLRPSSNHVPVVEYVTHGKFEMYKRIAKEVDLNML